METTTIIAAVVIGIFANLLASYLYKPIQNYFRRLQKIKEINHSNEFVSDKDTIKAYLQYLTKYEKRSFSNLPTNENEEQNRQTSDFYFPIKYQALEDNRLYTSSFENLLKFKGKKIALVGSPGSGKTTLVRFLVTELAKKYSDELILPIYFEANELSIPQEKPPVEWLIEHIKSKSQISFRHEFIESQLATGKLWIIIDSIDSVSTVEKREQLLKLLVNVALRYPDSGILVTLRTLLKNEVPVKFENFELVGLSSEDAKEFVRRTTSVILEEFPDKNVNLKTVFAKHSVELLETLEFNETLKDSVSNPLLLKLVYENHFHKPILPNTRALLYQEYLSTIISRSPNLPPRSTYAILEKLALYMSTSQKSDISAHELIEITEDISNKDKLGQETSPALFVNYCRQVGLLSETSESSYSFFHRSFQEYLAARAILYNSEEEQLIHFFPSLEWQKISLMYCSISRDSSNLIENLFGKSSKSTSDVIFFGTCLKESTYVNKTLKIKVIRLLSQKLLDEQSGTAQYAELVNSCKGISHPSVSSTVLTWVQSAAPLQKYKGLRVVQALGEIDEDISDRLDELADDDDFIEENANIIKIGEVAESVKSFLQLADEIEAGKLDE